MENWINSCVPVELFEQFIGPCTNCSYIVLTHDYKFYNEGVNNENIDLRYNIAYGGIDFYNKELYQKKMYMSTSYDYYHEVINFTSSSIIFIGSTNFSSNSLVLGPKKPINECPWFEDMQLIIKCIKTKPNFIKFFNNLSEEIIINIVKANPMCLNNVTHQTETICLEAIKRSPCTIHYVNNKLLTIEFVLKALKINDNVISYLPSQYKNNDAFVLAFLTNLNTKFNNYHINKIKTDPLIKKLKKKLDEQNINFEIKDHYSMKGYYPEYA